MILNYILRPMADPEPTDLSNVYASWWTEEFDLTTAVWLLTLLLLPLFHNLCGNRILVDKIAVDFIQKHQTAFYRV